MKIYFVTGYPKCYGELQGKCHGKFRACSIHDAVNQFKKLYGENVAVVSVKEYL